MRALTHAALTVVALAVPAGAQTVPRLEVDASVLTSANPLLLPGRKLGALQMDVSVRPGISRTSPDGSTFDLGAVITERAYSRFYGNVVVGRLDATAEYRRSEYLSIGGSASFARDLAVDLLTSSVEAAADPTSVRSAYRARMWITARPDAQTSLRSDFGFARSQFTRTGLLSDTRSVDASLAYTVRASERTQIGARAGLIASQAAGLPDTATQMVYATLDQQLSASWRATGEMGVERNGARDEPGLSGGAHRATRVLLSGRAALCRTVAGPSVCVRGALNTEVSGLGGLTRRAVIGTSVRHQLDRQTALDIGGEYQRSTMQGDVFPAFDAIRATAILERMIGRDLAVSGTVQYLRRRLIDGQRIGATFGGLRLTWSTARR